MDPSEKVGNELYQNLGKLFYAIAIADRKVKIKEVEKLRQDVRKYWLDVDAIEDEFGSDAAYQIEIVFDWLNKEENEGGYYFDEFKDFYREHPSKFDSTIKQLIWRTANDIADSYAGKNKSELVVLGKLKLC
ncbi:hypothetical protein [Pareuzebyella sediminis]|uniref:hypothetical protein n=1 Tax=Pareuzebyella sediminis TaxID=2607998 RepID=UPI0011ECD71F|nr:hypothetical protein [Pareuzebyella sediminis]